MLIEKHVPRALSTLFPLLVQKFGAHGMTSSMDKFSLPDRYNPQPSVWVEFIKLASDYKPLNLGQGFPDFAAPSHITQALANIATGENVLNHQYTRGFGHPRLVSALSKLYSHVLGWPVDAQTEVLVTSGAYEALYSCILGHTSPGDEVIIIEPFFDCYEPMVTAAGGKPVFIPLRPKSESGVISSGDWKLDETELASLFNKKTKSIIVNTPNNPLGKVFTQEELTVIADLCKKWNVLCISDEVYEWMVYEPCKHIRIATLPNMWERTITIGSAGKAFSVTGWKTGWAYGPNHLMKNLYIVHQNCVYTCTTPIQEAVAQSMEFELERFGTPDCYFESLARELLPKRDFMVKMLIDAGMTPTVPEGGYFIIVDWSKLVNRVNLDSETSKFKDYRFAKWMTKNVGLQGIPPSAFYSEQHKSLAENYIRYCFIKSAARRSLQIARYANETSLIHLMLIQKHGPRALTTLFPLLVQKFGAHSMTSAMDKFSLPDRYKPQPSVWVEFVKLASDYKPLNLGQGFPDFAPPSHITQALANIATGENVLNHQYTRGFGHPRLVAALSKLYSRMLGWLVDAQTEVLVSTGAYEALFSCILGHTSPGDEVIIIEPFFDCYEPMVTAAGGKPVFIPLRPKSESGVISSGDWKLDETKLASLFNKKTKSIIVTTPNNPLGKVFTEKELTVIADLCKKWNVLCISDEVYEWMVYEPNKHIRIATLPNMWERTITIGSAGKVFSVTGWKTGWAYGPNHLMKNLYFVHQNCVYTCTTPIQEAVAQSMEFELERFGTPDCYFESLARELLPKRDFMVKMLIDTGMTPTVPEGGYFIIADWSKLANRVNLDSETSKYKDYRFAKWMTKNVGLQGIPPSAFYSEQHKSLAENYIRYCFIKKDENLQKAADILKKWKEGLSKL